VFVLWLGLALSKFYSWRTRYGKANEHNAQVPHDHWLEDWEKQAILDLERQYPVEGYRRLAFMMLDEDVAGLAATFHLDPNELASPPRRNRVREEEPVNPTCSPLEHAQTHAMISECAPIPVSSTR
jgi:hypothetical protein